MERHRPRSIPIKEDLLYSRHWAAPHKPTKPGLPPRPGFLYGLVETTGQSEAFDEVISALPD